MVEKVFLYPRETDNWYFVPITKKVGLEIRKEFGTSHRGFGSIPVEVIVGKTVWATSIFPDKYSGSYILPLKAKVRKSEGIYSGDKLKFAIKICV